MGSCGHKGECCSGFYVSEWLFWWCMLWDIGFLIGSVYLILIMSWTSLDCWMVGSGRWVNTLLCLVTFRGEVMPILLPLRVNNDRWVCIPLVCFIDVIIEYCLVKSGLFHPDNQNKLVISSNGITTVKYHRMRSYVGEYTYLYFPKKKWLRRYRILALSSGLGLRTLRIKL